MINEERAMPSIQRLPASGATTKDIIANIKRDGAVIVTGLMSEEIAWQIYSETINYVRHAPVGNDTFTGSHTTRTGALVARSSGCCELVTNSQILDVANEFLKPYCDRVQLHLTQIIRIKPGQPEQVLHRDRQAWGKFLPDTIEPQLNTIWALTEFTQANGATQVVPGSQDWELTRRARKDEIVYAEMPRGSVLIYSGSVIHGGGRNSSADERLGINLTYSLAWLRQEENQFLSCPPDVAASLDSKVQELLGYTMGSVACGYYSQLLPAGQAKEVCAPEYALGRAPNFSIKINADI